MSIAPIAMASANDVVTDQNTAAASTNEIAIDEIKVTATRRPVSVNEVSSALALVEADVVHSQKILTDALASSAGVFLQQTTPGQGAVIIRGLKGSAILHLVDGLRLNNAIFRSAPTQYLALVPPGAVERIEVVRGSPTSLYGSDAVGGVVQVVSRVPRFDSDTIDVRGNASVAFDTAELGQMYRGTVDAGSRNFSSSLSASYLRTGDRRTGSGERIGPSGYTAQSARVLLAAMPDDDRSWLFDMHFLRQPNTPRIDELVPGFGESDPSSSEFRFAPNQRLFVHGAYAQTGGWYDLDWKLDLAWQQIVDDRVQRNFLATERRREANRSDLFAATVSGSRQTESGSWIVGGELYSDRVHSTRSEEDLITGQRQSVTPRFPDRSTVKQAAIFGNASYRLSDRNALTGGMRFTSVSIRLPVTLVLPSTSIEVTELSGDVGWIFDLSNSWQIFANIGRGFRAPNVFDLGSLGERPGNRFNIPNRNLSSERILNGDLGFRYRTHDLQFDMTVYRLRYDDRITSTPTGSTTSDGRDIVQSTNVASASIHGIETGAQINLTERLNAHAVVNYTWGEQALGIFDEPADRVPPLSGTLQLSYDVSPNLGFDTWLRFADSQNRLSARDIRDVRIDPNGTAGWGSLGIRAYWERGELWRLTAGIDNILDKQYRTHGSGIDAAGQNFSVSFRRAWQ